MLLPGQVSRCTFSGFSVVLFDSLIDLMSTYIAHSMLQLVQLSQCSAQVKQGCTGSRHTQISQALIQRGYRGDALPYNQAV